VRGCGRLAVAAPWWLLAACAGFGPPSSSTAARLQPMALAAAVPGRFELELASAGLNGTFDAVVAVDADAVRLQVFPDVGGKLVDLRVAGDAITADLGGAAYRAAPPYDVAEPSLALVLAAIVGELATPVTASTPTVASRSWRGATSACRSSSTQTAPSSGPDSVVGWCLCHAEAGLPA
jgi:hypothetical protein